MLRMCLTVHPQFFFENNIAQIHYPDSPANTRIQNGHLQMNMNYSTLRLDLLSLPV